MRSRSLTAAGLVTILSVAAPATHGDVKQVWLGVQGATCPKCGFGLAKALNDLPGVAKARLIVTPQHMEVRLQPGAWVDPARMLKLARKSNLKSLPDDTRLTVTGKVEKRDERLVVVLDQMRTPVELTVVPHSSAPESAAQLARRAGEWVEAEGYWPPTATATLAVTSFKVLKKPDVRPRG